MLFRSRVPRAFRAPAHAPAAIPYTGGMSENSETEVLDATGLRCPMPLLKAKKALNAMASGERLQVIATDPGSERDFEVFSRQSGHELERAWREGERYLYLLRKA